jgi:hypothetical protein
MKLFAPTISEAVLDLLNTHPLSEKFSPKHGWEAQYLCEQVESNYCVRGFAKGISRDCFIGALKSLKQRKLIRWDGHYVNLRVWSGKQSWISQVKPLEQGDLISTESNHYVYYIQWDNDPFHVKIGYSSRPAQRFVDFLTSNPHKLVVLRLQKIFHKDEEQRLHHEFRAFRQNREWFAYAGYLREHIEKLNCETAQIIAEDLTPYYREQILIRSF